MVHSIISKFHVRQYDNFYIRIAPRTCTMENMVNGLDYDNLI